MERGKLVIESVGGKSRLTRCFSMYPFKFIVPNKVASSQADAVWIYTLTYGGGIVSGDSIGFDVTVGDGCTAVLTTQSSTKVYKSIGSKCSEQLLENYRVLPGSSLLLVDWITSGRHESGEKWAFSHYKSTNRILLEGTEPLFLDTILLEQGSQGSICDRMKDYQAIAMIVLLGPKLKFIQNQIEGDVKKLMSQQLSRSSCNTRLSEPSFVASCSAFGPKGIGGVVIRVASMTTEAIYAFLQHQLASMEKLIGAPPYR